MVRADKRLRWLQYTQRDYPDVDVSMNFDVKLLRAGGRNKRVLKRSTSKCTRAG